MSKPVQHPFPAVEEWINELQSAEKDFREVLERIRGMFVSGYTVDLIDEVLAKHPAEGKS